MSTEEQEESREEGVGEPEGASWRGQMASALLVILYVVLLVLGLFASRQTDPLFPDGPASERWLWAALLAPFWVALARWGLRWGWRGRLVGLEGLLLAALSWGLWLGEPMGLNLFGFGAVVLVGLAALWGCWERGVEGWRWRALGVVAACGGVVWVFG